MLQGFMRCSYILDAVSEYRKSVTEFFSQAPSPPRVLRPEYVPFRVRHETEDPPGEVADAGNVVNRTIRIVRIRCAPSLLIAILKDDEAILFETP
jgi:hypothetical protein